MINIPNISFESREGATDIELIRISELFSRKEHVLNPNPKLPHRIGFFALIIITEGKGVHQVDLKEYEMRTGSILKISKGQIHAFINHSQSDGYLIVFTERLVLKYFSLSSRTYVSHFYNYHISNPLVENNPFYTDFLEQVKTEFESKNTYIQKEIIAKILELFLLRLERQTQGLLIDHVNKDHHSLFSRFKNLVEEDHSKTRNVKDYAEQLSVSPKHLNLVVREFTMNTAKSFIDQYVTLEIQRRILSTNLSLKEIAFQLGFDEMTNFSKFFKRRTNISPKEFRSN